VPARNNTAALQCVLTHQEIAKILTEHGYPVTAKIVWHLERSALRKMALDPLLRQLAEDAGLLTGDEPPED
jgi:hypothetical protein